MTKSQRMQTAAKMIEYILTYLYLANTGKQC